MYLNLLVETAAKLEIVQQAMTKRVNESTGVVLTSNPTKRTTIVAHTSHYCMHLKSDNTSNNTIHSSGIGNVVP